MNSVMPEMATEENSEDPNDKGKKKKKYKKESGDNESVERKKRITAKPPESIDDIQKEIKSWVLNKGIGESHLHRAARLGYVVSLLEIIYLILVL